MSEPKPKPRDKEGKAESPKATLTKAEPKSEVKAEAAKAEAPPVDASKAELGKSETGKAEPVKAEGKKNEMPIDRRALAEQYIPYVRSIAGKIKKSVAKDIDFEDLVEYGMIGLLEAADRYDPKYGANFMTFAYYRIRGAIYDGLRGMGWMSRSEYAKARFEERANEYLAEMATEASSQREDSDDSAFEHAVQDLAAAVQGLAAVYITTIDGVEGLQLKDEKTPIPEENLGLEQARALVRQTIKKLSGQERQLLEMYYYKDMSLQEVGEKLGLSKSWTSRLHARVIEKLHRLLEDSLG